MHLAGDFPEAGPDGGNRHHKQEKGTTPDKDRHPVHAVGEPGRWGAEPDEQNSKKNAAASNQHRIQRRSVVGTRASQGEKREGDDKRPAKKAVAPALLPNEVEPQAQESQRGSDKVHAEPKLLPEKSVVAALPQVAGMQMGQELQRDEVVLHLPDDVRQKDENGNTNTDPKPAAAQVTPGRREEHGVTCAAAGF